MVVVLWSVFSSVGHRSWPPSHSLIHLPSVCGQSTSDQGLTTNDRFLHPSSSAELAPPPTGPRPARDVCSTYRFPAAIGWLAQKTPARPRDAPATESGGGCLRRRLASSRPVPLQHRSCAGADL